MQYTLGDEGMGDCTALGQPFPGQSVTDVRPARDDAGALHRLSQETGSCGVPATRLVLGVGTIIRNHCYARQRWLWSEIIIRVAQRAAAMKLQVVER